MEILKNYDLSGLNTFGVSARADFFVRIDDEADFRELFLREGFKRNPKLFLGGGSNVLFTEDFQGIVVLNRLRGIEIVGEDSDSVRVRAMGGELWHNLVEFAVSRGYWGVENLSLIPGTVGAAPMQNIGAYGAEIKDVLESVEAFDVATGEKRIFRNEECAFGYRDSVFKQALKGKYFISAITLRLSKHPAPNISYKILADYLEKNGVIPDTPKKISDAVADIRRSKLPDPARIGNAGSFFKNVILEPERAKEFLSRFPETPSFREEGFVKIPAGWLIEQCGLKGFREGNVGMHEKQALVLVNYGGATGREIKDFADLVISRVREKFGLSLSPEVNFV
ncbi:MAG TPA: UDP-N-acetylmuramate dehydrogenase [Candidatus Paceibacterota bacterium]|nr:UDP-N-acetylmuramate dehydrogenase [Candidatus Paceibacterota bacterium]